MREVRWASKDSRPTSTSSVETGTSLPNTATASAISNTNLSDKTNSLPAAPGEVQNGCVRDQGQSESRLCQALASRRRVKVSDGGTGRISYFSGLATMNGWDCDSLR